ncbi:MAG: hypothetical protein HQM03_21405 [Magnetococcales bacterium]|nr:hypothetical protein [Magnetococcales bacterium]
MFGDSFLENTTIAVQYSVSEPLGFVLNALEPHARGVERYEVLNFGISGYGTD